MEVAAQAVVAAVIPLNCTVPDVPRFVPTITNALPAGALVIGTPVVVWYPVMTGSGAVIVNVGPVALCPPTVMTTGPASGKLPGVGTVTVTAVAVQLEAAALLPLNVTTPRLPRFVPVTTTVAPGTALLMGVPPVV